MGYRKHAFVVPAVAGLAAGGAGAVGRGVMRAAANQPVGVALGTAGTVALGPGTVMPSPEARAQAKQQNMQRRYLAGMAGGSVKTSSVSFSESEVRRGLAIRRGLEKTAKVRAMSNKGIMGMIGDAIENLGKKVGPRGADDVPTIPEIIGKRVGEELTESTGVLSPLGPLKLMGAGLALGAGMGAAGAMTAGAAYGIGKGTEMVRGMSQAKRYKNMVKADPDLARHPMSRSYFAVLDKASPYISGEPQVAAATVRSMLEAPEGYAMHPKFMRDILGVEEGRQKTRFPMLRAPTFKGELPEV